MRGRKAQSDVTSKRAETRQWCLFGIGDYKPREFYSSSSQSRGSSLGVRQNILVSFEIS